MQKKEKIRRSFWEKDVLNEDYDFLVLGGGIVGCNAALTLREMHKDARICVMDKYAIPTGASSRNAGFACFGSVTELLDDLQSHSEDELCNLIAYRWEGLQKLRRLIGDNILDYQNYGGIEVLNARDTDNDVYCSQISYLNNLIKKSTGMPNTFSIVENAYGFQNIDARCIINQYEGQLHPGKMMGRFYALLDQHNIQRRFGYDIEGYKESSDQIKIITHDDLRITCNHLLIATNAFTKKILPEIDLIPGRNQVLMTKPIPNLPWKGCFHYDKGYVYFRNYGNRVLIGGGRNIDATENQSSFGLTTKINEYLRDILDTIVLPGGSYEEDCWWSGIIAFSDVKSPIVKKYSDKITLGVRLGGMGVAIGSLVGEKLANLALS